MGRVSHVLGFMMAAVYATVLMLVFSHTWAAGLIGVSGALWLLRDRFLGVAMLVLAAVLLLPDPL